MSNHTPDDLESRRPIYILSLDGGGVRGISSLFLLRDLMTRLGEKKGVSRPSDFRPCDFFDLIIGTGTGGISALFLGHMQMTVDEAIKEYLYTAKSAFKPSPFAKLHQAFGRSGAVLDGRALEKSIRDVASRYLDDPNVVLADSQTCRIAVLAATDATPDSPPHILRSYATALPACQFKLQGVARATAAIGGLFAPIMLGKPPMEFINSEHVAYNNPTDAALDEAALIWSSQKYRIAGVVSLGTGLQKTAHIEGKWAKLAEVSARLYQDCENVHVALLNKLKATEVSYFRFNITPGLDEQVMEWHNSVEQMAEITKGYTSIPKIAESFQQCVEFLNGESLVEIDRPTSKYLPLSHPVPKIFHGCEKYVSDAVDLLVGSEGVHLAILGSSGIGKTSIAKSIMHDERIKSKFAIHQYFISCQSISFVTVLVDTLYEVFSLQATPVDRQNNLMRFLKKEYTAQPLLLILDSFETVWRPTSFKVENFLACLTQAAGISLIVTMCGTEQPAGLSWTTLPVVTSLDPIPSYKTFLDISNTTNSDVDLDKLLNKLDHIPLAVTLMAQLGQTETPLQLLQRWEKVQDRMERHSDQDGSEKIDISITVTLESSIMQACPEALLLLSVIALLPAGIPKEDLPLICPNIPNLDSAVATLYQVGLASYDSMKMLNVLSPIRLYVLENHPPAPLSLQDMQSFYFKLAAKARYINDSRITNHKALHQAEGNLEAILIRGLKGPGNDDDDDKIQAAIDWTNFLHYTTPRNEIIKLALDLSRQENIQPTLEPQCLQLLGNISVDLGDFQKAKNMFHRARKEFQSLDDQIEAAQCWRSFGNLHYKLGNYSKAKNVLKAAQAEFQALNIPLGVALCNQCLGNIYKDLKEYPQALEVLTIAQEIFQSLDNQMQAAICLQLLGYIYYNQSEYSKAQEKYFAAQIKFQFLGEKQSAAHCMQYLGHIYNAFGDYLKALETFATTQEEFESLGNKLSAAHCLHSQAVIYYVDKDYNTAQKIATEAHQIFDSLGSSQQAADCLKLLHQINSIRSHKENANK